MDNVTSFEVRNGVPPMNYWDKFPTWTKSRWELYDKSLQIRFMLTIIFVVVFNMATLTALLMKNPRADIVQRNTSLVFNLCITHFLIGIAALFPPWHYMTIWPSQLHYFFPPNESMFDFMVTIFSFYHISLLVCVAINVNQIIRLFNPSLMEPDTTARGIITAVLLFSPWIVGITTVWVLPNQGYTPIKIRVIEVVCIYFIPVILILVTCIILVIAYLYFLSKMEMDQPDLGDMTEMKHSRRCIISAICLSALTIFIGLPEHAVAIQEASVCNFEPGCIELSSPRESYIFKLIGSVASPVVWLMFPDIRKRFGRLLMCICCCECKRSSIYDDEYT